MTLIPTHPFAAAMSDGDALALAGVLLCVVVGCVCYGRGMSKGERDAERRHALTGRHTERVITSRTRKYEIEEVYKVKREVPLPAPQQPPPQALPQPPQESRYLPPPRQRPDEVVDAEFEEKGLPRLPAPRALPPAPPSRARAGAHAALAGAMYISRRWPEGGAGEKYLLDVASVIELSILAYLKLAANDIPPNGPGEETRGCTPR